MNTSLPHSHIKGQSCVVFNCPWNYLQGLPPALDLAAIDAKIREAKQARKIRRKQARLRSAIAHSNTHRQ
jgi:hypothetical protein